MSKKKFGLGYKLTLRRNNDNNDNTVSNKDNAINNAKTKINATEWCVPQYSPSIPQQAILSEQNLCKRPTELQYVERSVFMKEVNTQNFWIYELGTQDGINVPYGLS